jgi:hypothetical protein
MLIFVAYKVVALELTHMYHVWSRAGEGVLLARARTVEHSLTCRTMAAMRAMNLLLLMGVPSPSTTADRSTSVSKIMPSWAPALQKSAKGQLRGHSVCCEHA